MKWPPWFLFHPRVTLASLVTLLTITAAQTAVLVGGKPMLVTLFGSPAANEMVDALSKAGAACGLSTMVLGCVAAYGRSPSKAVDNNLPPVTLVKDKASL